MRRESYFLFRRILFIFIFRKIMTATTLEPRLALPDRNGIYIPQLYCNQIDEKIAEEMNVEMEDVLICQSGPDHEWYWESWDLITSNAEWIETQKFFSNGEWQTKETKWHLYQEGDLWELPEGFSFDEEV